MNIKENDSNSLTSETRGGQTTRGGRSGDRGRGRTGHGWQHSYSDLQLYERYTIRQGRDLPWLKWESGAKAALRPAYGAQVEAVTRILQEELHPVLEPEFSPRNLNNRILSLIDYRSFQSRKQAINTIMTGIKK